MDSHSSSPRSESAVISDEEYTLLHADDVHAGKAVIFEMAAIFTLGLFIYLIVLIWVAASPLNAFLAK